jgi:hypothetical protein
MRVEGQCHCGAITYEAEVEPDTIGICHCRDCQRLTGSAFRANILAPADSFRILKGRPRQYVKTADSGAKRIHAFCEVCSSPVYACAIEAPRTYSLRLGALNQPEALGRPAQQIWTKRRLPWIPAIASVPEVEGQPHVATSTPPLRSGAENFPAPYIE